MANPIKSFRKSLGQIPTKYRFWASFGILVALLIALPVTLIGLMTGTFELRKRAVTAEPTPSFPTATPSATLTPTLTPTPTPTPTPTVASSSITLEIRFGGVTSRPLDDSDKEIKIYATNLTGGPDLGSADSKETVVLSVDDSGIYQGQIDLPGDYFGHRYRLRIKGPKHLQGVFPDVYFQVSGELDLTNAPLRPGDLDQDGKVDVNDLQAVKVFSADPADIAVSDVNFDGKVSILDRTLVLNTLSVQYDPE